MLDNTIWRAIEPNGICRRVTALDSFCRIFGIAFRTDYFMSFERDGNNNTGTYISTTPAITAAPELKTNVKLSEFHTIIIIIHADSRCYSQ